MNIDTARYIWKRECFAHGYVGFLIVDVEGTLSRVFLHCKGELEPARNSMRIHGHDIIEEVMI